MDDLQPRAYTNGEFKDICERLARTFIQDSNELGKDELILRGRDSSLLLSARQKIQDYLSSREKNYKISIYDPQKETRQNQMVYDVEWFFKNPNCLAQ